MKKIATLMALLCLLLVPVSNAAADDDRELEPVFVPGDMNGDGVVTYYPDLGLFFVALTTSMANNVLGIIIDTPGPGDVNGDGVVDLLDVDPFVEILGKSD